jgi:hypothetical protein
MRRPATPDKGRCRFSGLTLDENLLKRRDRGRERLKHQQEVALNWNRTIRQTHRWLSIIFTLTVIANFAARIGGNEPPAWVTYSPLPPLFLLLFTGLYMFVLPYTAKRRTGA